eukprot:gnl/MRDRNA2_/MRDRNA2_84398_c0_seq1.p1 gnl/MRDRNA2_/MRDRNA2_84398_c0~~gnl/MRDRNA2_/MRDRNA2_84398_c0_seq1.p1  ORF type:complete len:168 (-),score=15.52 gnl/MRDRNA2_/MRDRNA2_84398_c0_seq1:206-709(-)
MGIFTRMVPKANGRYVVVDGADCRMEVNGTYVETSVPCDGKPQFVNSELPADKAQVVLSWNEATQRWTIRKLVLRNPGRRVFYVASALTGADVTGEMPPADGWAASGFVDKQYKAYIQPAPRLTIHADRDASKPSLFPSRRPDTPNSVTAKMHMAVAMVSLYATVRA